MGGLAEDLAARVEGDVRFDAGSRALVATGGSNYRQLPIGVVAPRTVDDVIEAVAVCREHDAPVLPLGADTSLAGQSTNAAVAIDFSRHLHHVVDIDAGGGQARVQPGVIRDHLDAAAAAHQLTFGPDPSTHAYCTLGGMIGNNSCGVHSVMAGKTVDNVEELDVLTYDGLRLRVGPTDEATLGRLIADGGRKGEIYRQLRELRDRYADLIRTRYPRLPRRVSGYNLDDLLPEHGCNVARALVGSEGTCVTILEATVRLVPRPRARSLLVLGYPDVYAAADHVVEVMAHGPIGLEGIDEELIADMRVKRLHVEELDLLPEGRGWLLVEFGGDDKDESDARARELMAALEGHGPSMKLYDDEDSERKVWEVREAGLGATAYVPGQPTTHEGWEDAAVPPERLGRYLRDFRALLDRYGYQGALYGHFGQGCVHTRIDFDLRTAAGIASFRSFVHDAADLVVANGGSLSGEHGDGQSRAELLPKMFGPDLVRAFAEFKAIWDPRNRMNPHKIVEPYRVDENLKLGTSYRPVAVRTHFRFPDDHGSFAEATRRCVGVGKCRRTGGGTMCPSFMVTREERHTTRGRAHLLFEMLEGDLVAGGWRDGGVKEALDLCLACKGCKGECPVNVDMATYKAEFLSHHYRWRLRPRSAYAMGLIHWAARVAAHAPGLTNRLTHGRLTGPLLKWAGGVAPEREIPTFADRTLRQRLGSGPIGRPDGRPVLLWIDTFTDHFEPHIGEAAIRVLTAAGFKVSTPERQLCCGRPLYDYGMLGLAKHLLRRDLEALRPMLTAGVPIVGLEPSCLAVFRDEVVNLFPDDPDALRLRSQAMTLGELFAREDVAPVAHLDGRALLHGHCHQKAVLGFGDDQQLLRSTGLDVDVLDAGCCGMAGSFGFERGEHLDVSIAAGERVLLPAVRSAPADALIVTDGFSCRQQIRQCTDRSALHLAEVLDHGLR
ncbi:MAG: FAD-binding oxidoreductase [Acidobacteria bacterium]|nr:FAD-binding oxidoreductase [Acidobacteriota bacterium]